MNIPDAITELGHTIGLPKLALNEAGLCRVIFDSTLAVDFESRADGRTLHLCSVVAPFEADDQEAGLFEALLSANFLGAGTGGASFSISTVDEEILLERTLDMDTVDSTSFRNIVESFVNHLEGWQQKVSAGGFGGEIASRDGGLNAFHFRA